ncbi:sensor histidine kinase [Sphingobacterium sp. SYP-B4668]|uniref:sensor histidine kinase n=1 Tax=Sphingobacterium sp. SYP-B4668 TaxID=2996035 RepID=UPI0022DDDB87|nr:sensor histidine kinase [Sphingobacterium sp. SYP-B4668]
MKRIYRVSYIFFMCVIAPLATFGQERIFNYLHFTIQDGLPSNVVRDAVVDKSGLLWIATNKGLCYYDGAHFFAVDLNEGESNFTNDLSRISIDQDNKIWMATYNQGLLCYDRTKAMKDAVTQYGAKVAGGELEKHELYAVHYSGSKVYFGGQETDLQVLDTKSKQINIVKLGNTIGQETIFSIREDRKGIIWVGTRYSGVYAYDPLSKKISHYDLKKDGENSATGFCFIDDATYVAYYDQDLIRIDHSLQQIVSRDIFGTLANHTPYANFVTDIAYIPTQHKILAAHVKDGLYSYDVRNKRIVHISPRDILPNELVDMRINTIIPVANGYYLCSNRGLFYYADKLNAIKELLVEVDDPILELFKVGESVWYRTAKHIGMLSADFGSRISTYSLEGLHISQIRAFGQKIYLSTFDKGVYLFDSTEPGIKPLEIVGPTFGFEKADCNSVLIDTLSGVPVLWIGSWNSGLYRYTFDTKEIVLYNRKNGLVDHKVITVSKDGSGAIWLGMDGFGAVQIKDKKRMEFINHTYQKTENSISSNTVFSFLLDSSKNFWYSTSDQGVGLIIDRLGKVSFEKKRDKNRFPWTYATSLEEDGKNRIWMKTSDGVMIFNPKDGAFFQLNPGDGLFPPNRFVTSNYYFDKETVIWMTNKGLVKGLLTLVEEDDLREVKPIVSAFKVMNHDQSYRLFADDIMLAPNENTFSFHFSSPQVPKTTRLRYSYKLEGVDKEWIASDDYQQAIYTNVPGGQYTFHLRVGDQEGNWSKHAVVIPLSVKLNWFQSLWFKVTVIGSIFLVVILFFVYRIGQQKKINRLQKKFTVTLQQELQRNERKIKEQAEVLEFEKQEKLETEFREKLYESELKAIRSQMNPHFIFNVLNSIEAYVVENDAESASKLIHKFASLSRIVLENSQFSIVSITSELQLVKLYLELEQDRFDHMFTYQIKIDSGLKMNSKKIPSMLIQPIVENAVHHGIRHRLDEQGKILIRVSEVEQKIIIEILDNGIGFESGDTSHSSYKATSFGLKGVENRLRMINSKLSTEIAGITVDKAPEEADYTVKVVIVLPSVD